MPNMPRPIIDPDLKQVWGGDFRAQKWPLKGVDNQIIGGLARIAAMFKKDDGNQKSVDDQVQAFEARFGDDPADLPADPVAPMRTRSCSNDNFMQCVNAMNAEWLLTQQVGLATMKEIIGLRPQLQRANLPSQSLKGAHQEKQSRSKLPLISLVYQRALLMKHFLASGP